MLHKCANPRALELFAALVMESFSLLRSIMSRPMPYRKSQPRLAKNELHGGWNATGCAMNVLLFSPLPFSADGGW